jgi:carboxyl-terminal processing protease
MPRIFRFVVFLSFVCAAVAQDPRPPSSPPEITKLVVSAIDERYFYADSNPAWKTARMRILDAKNFDNKSAYGLIAAELTKLRDSELHLVTPAEGAAIDQEGKGTALGTGLIDFGIDVVPETGEARVVTPLVSSPAAKEGVRPHDVIVSINGELTSALDHEQVADALRQNAADLVLRRGKQTLHVHLQRSGASLPAVAGETKPIRGGKIAYIRIAQFTPNSGDVVRAKVKEFESDHSQGYILDLRNNPGGFFGAAETVAGVFTSGTLAAKVRKNGDVEPMTTSSEPLTKAPMVLLVNEGTASAAEFLVGALQDLRRAQVVGAPTYGRGQAQVYVPVADGYGLVIPSALIRTPSGKLFKGTGLQPDLLVRSQPLAEADLGTSRDPQFQAAVAVLLKPKASLPAAGRKFWFLAGW